MSQGDGGSAAAESSAAAANSPGPSTLPSIVDHGAPRNLSAPSTNLAVIRELVSALTDGRLVGDGGDEIAARLAHASCLVDADSPTAYASLCRKFRGPMGLVEFARELAQLELGSLQQTLNLASDGRVFVELTYVPTALPTGRSGPPVCDMHTWTVRDGQAVGARVRWGDASEIDALFGPAPAADRPLTVMIGEPSTGGDPSWPLVFVSSYTKLDNLAHGPKGTEAEHSMRTFRLNPSVGSLTLLSVNHGDTTMNPAFSRANARRNLLYACTESVEENGKIVTWEVDSTSGRLTKIGSADAQGTSTCYVTLDRSQKNALVVNYWNATIVVLAIDEETGAIDRARSVFDPNEGRPMAVRAGSHVKHSINTTDAQRERQLDPHSHAVILDPYTGRIAYVPDLGMDVIRQLVYDPKAGTLKAAGTVSSGLPGRRALGPRYIEFHPRLPVAYVINELSSEVAVFEYSHAAAKRVVDTGEAEPTLHLVQMISTLPVAFPGCMNTCGRITVHSSGRFVLVSNRGHDSIAVFRVDFESSPPGLLTVKSIAHTRGSCPRHFAFDSSGMWLLAANQDSDSITMFHFNISTGDFDYTGNTISVPSPNFICFLDPNLALDVSPLPPKPYVVERRVGTPRVDRAGVGFGKVFGKKAGAK